LSKHDVKFWAWFTVVAVIIGIILSKCSPPSFSDFDLSGPEQIEVREETYLMEEDLGAEASSRKHSSLTVSAESGEIGSGDFEFIRNYCGGKKWNIDWIKYKLIPRRASLLLAPYLKSAYPSFIEESRISCTGERPIVVERYFVPRPDTFGVSVDYFRLRWYYLENNFERKEYSIIFWEEGGNVILDLQLWLSLPREFIPVNNEVSIGREMLDSLGEPERLKTHYLFIRQNYSEIR